VGDYPGAACDVEAYQYLPLLRRVGFVPSRKYVAQAEIGAYADLLAGELGITPCIRFNTKVVDARYVGDECDVAPWEVSTAAGESIFFRHLAMACGPLSTPKFPQIRGMGSFRGPTFHTARWDHDVSLAGKRVGIVGTGASAAQVITAIADTAAHTYVFQRTPVWAIPRNDQPTSVELRTRIMDEIGFVDRLRREETEKNDRENFPRLHDPVQNDEMQKGMLALIEKEVPDDVELRKQLTPDYPFWCKRVLVIDNYYSTFTKPTVSLVADPGGVVEETSAGVRVASGAEYELDAIVYATGFDALTVAFPIRGRGGRTLAEHWGGERLDRPRTLFGVHVSGFPNLHFLVGPQSINPVTNITLVSEDQSLYLAALLRHMREAGLRRVEPSIEAEEEWVQRVEGSVAGKVWTRCSNWYLKTYDGGKPFYGMWMDTHTDYLRIALRREGGTRHLLEFTA
jgi:cation diffusion facilitator CzcD-associated flavoprotein CzcO